MTLSLELFAHLQLSSADLIIAAFFYLSLYCLTRSMITGIVGFATSVTVHLTGCNVQRLSADLIFVSFVTVPLTGRARTMITCRFETCHLFPFNCLAPVQ